MALPDSTQRSAYGRFIDAVMRPITASFGTVAPEQPLCDTKFPEVPAVQCGQCELAAIQFHCHWMHLSLWRLL